MQPARATWTDERLDDLARDVRDLRLEVRSGDEALRSEIRAGDEALRSEMSARFSSLDTRFSNLERAIHWVGGSMIFLLLATLLEGRL
jgi:hypothetical protein